MPERRIVSRREPIVVEVEGVGEFEARPLQWRDRNNLGNEVAKQYVAALNKLGAERQPDDEGEDLRGQLLESLIDWKKLLEMAYPDADTSALLDSSLDFYQVLEVMQASLEVNKLDRFAYMLDSSKEGPSSEATEAVEETADGPRIESLPVSSSQDSLDQTSTG